MRKIAAIYTWMSLQDACPVIRLEGPLRARGWQLLWSGAEDSKADAVSQADIVIVQREFPALAKELYYRIVDRCHAEGKPIIYEIDDLLTDVPADHPSYCVFSPFKNALIEAAQAADCVTVSTQALKSRFNYLNSKVEVVANYLNDSIWKLRAPVHPPYHQPIVIGYCGTQTHKQDVDLVAPALASILKAYKNRVQLQFWGIAPPTKLRGLSGVSWIPLAVKGYCEFVDFMLQQSCDIFLAPLVTNDFNSCKSAIKFLEHAALGAAGVYSKITPYEEIVEHGKTGFLAHLPEEWEQFLSLLIEDSNLRLSIAEQSQKELSQNWLLSRQSAQCIDVYDNLLSCLVKLT